MLASVEPSKAEAYPDGVLFFDVRLGTLHIAHLHMETSLTAMVFDAMCVWLCRTCVGCCKVWVCCGVRGASGH